MTGPGGIGGPGDNRPRSRLFRAAPDALFVDEEVPSIRMPAPPLAPLEEEGEPALDEDDLLSALAADETEEEPIREGPARIYVGSGLRVAAPPADEEEEEDVLTLDEDLEESLGGPAVEVPGAVPGAQPDLRILERKPMVVPPPRAVAGDATWRDAPGTEGDEEEELWAGLAPPGPQGPVPSGAAPWVGEGEAESRSKSRGFIKPPMRLEPATSVFTSRIYVRTILLAVFLLVAIAIGWWLFHRHSPDRAATEPVPAQTWSVDLTGGPTSPGPAEAVEPEVVPDPGEVPPVAAPEPEARPQAEAPRERTTTTRSTPSRTTSPSGSAGSETSALWDTPPPEPPPVPVSTIPVATGPITPIQPPSPTSPITLPAPLKGRITIESDQAAVIFMSGERKGTTPIVDMEVPVAAYTIRATSRESGLSQSQIVEVKAGETQSIRFTFQE